MANSNNPQIHLIGIRHHGPGSARRLLHFLEEFQPDVLVIEAPEELETALPYLSRENLTPPVAVLIYNPKNLQQATYYPFATFSPEWQALCYAQNHQVAVIPMDLPQKYRFAEKNATRFEISEKEKKQLQTAADPLAEIAKIAGYEDAERWWEATFEQYHTNTELFDSIHKMMAALREQYPYDSPQTKMREAYMRQTLRKVLKMDYKRIAVVCGAWHTPALDNLENYTIKADQQLLKGLAKVKTTATWIPWSYQQLASGSGYGAGVIAPKWYEYLFEKRKDAVIQWMAQTAQLMREEGFASSSAHAIEAVRLANMLASMRFLQLPGIQELSEAAQTIFAEGKTAPLQLIHERLIIGNAFGETGTAIPVIPLQQDIDKKIKSLRLPKTAQQTWLKASKTKPRGGLDLRKTHDLKQSQFLHQLKLLGIHWGQTEQSTGRELSNKNEYWVLQWLPDFYIQIIQAGIFGNTIEQAAHQKTAHDLKRLTQLPELLKLTQSCLKANLLNILPELLFKIQQLTAQTTDIDHLMQALPQIVQIIRYGDIRNTNSHQMQKLLDEIIPRVAIGLPQTVSSISDDHAKELLTTIIQAHQAMLILGNTAHLKHWLEALTLTTLQEKAHHLIKGYSTRILLQQKTWSLEKCALQMTFYLSPQQPPMAAAQWIEGFLYQGGVLLIHHPVLFQIVDDWVKQLPPQHFKSFLPILRRTFSQFSETERKKLWAMAKSDTTYGLQAHELEFDPQRKKLILPTLKLFLGIG